MSRPIHPLRWGLAIAAMALLASCGGGSSKTDQPVTELSESDNAVLSGSWELRGDTRAFIVRSDTEWQAAWLERKAQLVCDHLNAPYNDEACAADGPPTIDFSRYSLIGLIVTPVGYFHDTPPDEVFTADDDHKLVVRYAYYIVYKVPYYLVTGTRFFLVPKTDLPLDARAKDVTPH